MSRKEEHRKLAELLFPNELKSPGDYENIYPERMLADEAMVTRLGPSPTGFIHLGNLYTAFMNERIAHESGGVFYLRIEDTDQKREVEGAAGALISALDHYGIAFDEGATEEDEKGKYGPYYQSDRKDIYHTFARELVLDGKAYPCFLTEDEIDKIRHEQEEQKLTPGIYGKWALHRDLAFGEIESRIKNNEKYVLRFKEDTKSEEYIEIDDAIRGVLSMPKNEMDVVILKNNGIPTYHFAHVVDDHLMRTTHVIRGEEWLSSLPVHIALFNALGFDPPIYAHTTVLMKMDGETKRKLSKRKDPELSLSYYKEEGYHPSAIREYLMTVINSNYEEWRENDPDAPIEDFKMTFGKMGTSGILFDLDKLNDISKNVLARIPAGELAEFLIDWAAENKPEVVGLLEKDKSQLACILDIGRSGDKPRKDLSHAPQMFDHISYFYDEYYEITDPRPEHIPADDVSILLDAYLDSYDHNDDRSIWFDKIRELSAARGYAAKPKDYKKDPDEYKGHVGDVSGLIRLALVGRKDSPDIYEIQQLLGEGRTRSRIVGAKDIL